jgi:hypothetical protein
MSDRVWESGTHPQASLFSCDAVWPSIKMSSIPSKFMILKGVQYGQDYEGTEQWFASRDLHPTMRKLHVGAPPTSNRYPGAFPSLLPSDFFSFFLMPRIHDALSYKPEIEPRPDNLGGQLQYC